MANCKKFTTYVNHSIRILCQNEPLIVIISIIQIKATLQPIDEYLQPIYIIQIQRMNVDKFVMLE